MDVQLCGIIIGKHRELLCYYHRGTSRNLDCNQLAWAGYYIDEGVRDVLTNVSSRRQGLNERHNFNVCVVFDYRTSLSLASGCTLLGRGYMR